jgi:thioredoxin-like negative regulator of GroEL
LLGLDRALKDGLPTAVVFISPDCGPCKALVPELARSRRAMDGRLTLLTVDDGASVFGVTATPSAMIVAPDGSVASGTATGVAGVEALVRSQLATDDLAL